MARSDSSGPSPRSKLVRVGLAGAGRFGRLHASVLAGLPGVQLAALAEPDDLRLRETADRHGVQARYRDAIDLIGDDTLDAIVLATPDELHFQQAIDALKKGRHLFVEKPLAGTWREAVMLRNVSEASGVHLQAGMILRYEMSHRLLQQQVAAGHFGRIVSIHCRRNCSRSAFAQIADRIHTVFRTLVHDIDLLLWLIGSRVDRVMSFEYREGTHLAPQGCFALLRFESGCVAHLESSWFVPDHAPKNIVGDSWSGCIDSGLALVGTHRSARIEGLHSPLRIWTDQNSQCPDTSLWPELEGQVHGALREQLGDFVTCIREGRTSSVASLESAVESIRIAEAIVDSATTGRPIHLHSDIRSS